MAQDRQRRWLPRGPAVGRALRDVFAIREVARIELGWGLSVTAGLVCTVAMLAFTYEAGGARLVAVYGIARSLPAAVVTPWVMGLVARVPREVLLRWATGTRAVLLTAAAATVLLGLPSVVPVALVGASAALSGSYRPLQADMLPWLVHTPAQLSASNATATVMENTASLAGPALAGVLLVVADPGVALAVAAAWMWAALAAVTAVRLPGDTGPVGTRGRSAPGGGARNGGPPRASRLAGLVALFHVLPRGGVLVLIFLQTFARGLLMVLVVVLVVTDLGIGTQGVGWLTAAMGLGGIVGGMFAVATLRLTWLTRAFVVGVALWSCALMVIWARPTTVVTVVAFVLVGIGNAMEDGSTYTLLPRVVERRLSPSVLGVVEVVAYSGAALGALAAPGLGSARGTTGAIGLVGAVVLAGVVLWARSAVTLDRSVPAPGPELDVVRALPMFAPLPVVTLESLVEGASTRRFAPGERVMTEGEPGDSLHVITDGTATVTVHGVGHPDLGPGDAFGEIALLRDVPRTATVTARSALSTLRIERSDFLRIVAGNGASATHAHTLASTRLAADTDTTGPSADPRTPQD